MKKQCGFISIMMLFVLLMWGGIIVSWCYNLVELTECDFEAPYKCEAVHGIGLFPPAAVVTAWIDVGK